MFGLCSSRYQSVNDRHPSLTPCTSVLHLHFITDRPEILPHVPGVGEVGLTSNWKEEGGTRVFVGFKSNHVSLAFACMLAWPLAKLSSSS